MARTKRDNAPLSYAPERGKYTVKSDAYILGHIKMADEIASTVTNLFTEVEGNQQTDINTVDFMVQLFTGKHELGIPQSKRYVNFDAKSAKPADIIFRVMGMLMAPLKPHYIPPFGTQKDKDLADTVERHLAAIYPWHFRKYEERFDIQNRFWQLLGGKSYIQQSYLPFHWDKEIRKRKPGETLGETDDADAMAVKNSMYNTRIAGYKGYAGPPIFTECLDPRTVFPIRTSMGTTAHIKRYKVERFQLQESFRRVGKAVTFGQDGKLNSIADLDKPAGLELPMQADTVGSSTTEYYEYIDDTYCYYVVDGQVAHRYQHNGGIKICRAMGLQTGFKEYALMAMGILWPVRNELPQFDFMRTLWVQKAYLDVFPQLFAQLAEGDSPLQNDAGAPREWNIEPMTVKQIRGTLVNALKDAQSGMDFRAAVEMFAGDIDLATISGLARGVAGAQQPGYAINQLSQAMRTNWKPIIESAELQGSMLYEHYLWMVKNIIREDVTVFGEVASEEQDHRGGEYLTLEWDKIPDFFRVEAQLDPELPIDTQGNMMTYAKLHQEGMVTWEDWVRDGMRKSNPTSYKKQVRKDLAERAFFPKAMEDAMALGRVELTNEIIQSRGLDKLNSIASMDIAALKAARAKQPAPDGQQPAGNGGSTVQPPAGPPGTPGAGPEMAPGTAGVTGNTPPSVGVTGSNPNNPTPAFRG